MAGTREELAQSWLDAVGDVTIHQVTPGSKYENSFVQNRVTVESAEPAAGLYDPELLAGQHFTFTNERIFVPGNYRSKEQQTGEQQRQSLSWRIWTHARRRGLSGYPLRPAVPDGGRLEGDVCPLRGIFSEKSGKNKRT